MTNPIINPQPNYSGVTIQISNPAVYAGQGVNPGVTQGVNPSINPGVNLGVSQRIQDVSRANTFISPNVNGATGRTQGAYPYNTNVGNDSITGYPLEYNSSNGCKCSETCNCCNTNADIIPSAYAYTAQGVTNPISNHKQYEQQEGSISDKAQNGSSEINSYPPQYYLNNYSTPNNGSNSVEKASNMTENSPQNSNANNTNISNERYSHNEGSSKLNQPNSTADGNEFIRGLNNKTANDYKVPEDEPQDFTKSQAVIDDLDARAAAEMEAKKNAKQKRVVALTDEYIKSLENYLNNPNDEIRLMASKEILTRLDEDKDRFDDAALNALLNKMLQDPSKLIRIAALSAFASQLASGNDYTVTLLHNIQQNPNADKEDVLQAADILLKMSAGTEIKYIPNPAIKETENKG